MKTKINKTRRVIKFLLIAISLLFITSCSFKDGENREKLYVYNWGIYIDKTTIEDFEKKYDCKVIYDEFDTNEEMYIIVESGSRVYDVICPTDYMIEKMMRNNLLLEIDYKNELKNFNILDEKVLYIMKSFDKNNSYSIPYVYSTIGVIYNKTILDEKGLPYPVYWSDLFNPIYKNEILMQDAMRDLMMVGLYKNNFSLNSTNIDEIDIATNDLIKQRPLVNGYVIDQVRDKMVMGEAGIGVTYSGEVVYIKEEGKTYNYEYILPKNKVNLTIDAWVIPKNAKNKELAIKWIDFMLEKDIARKNYEYMHYGIPNTDVIKELPIEEQNDKSIFPDLNNIDKYELYKDLGDFEQVYSDHFKKIKSN